MPVALAAPGGMPVIPSMTRTQMDVVLPAYAAMVALGVLHLVGPLGVIVVARGVDGRGRTLARVGFGLALAAGGCWLAADILRVVAAATFRTPTFAADPLFVVSEAMMSGGLIMIATLLVTLGLRRSGRLRRSGTVMSVVAGVYAAFSAATVLTAPPVLQALTGSLVVWMPLGILLLRRPRPAR